MADHWSFVGDVESHNSSRYRHLPVHLTTLSLFSWQKLKAEFKDKVYTFNGGKMKGMAQRVEDEAAEQVTVEAEISLGDTVSCSFGIEAKKGGSGDDQDIKPTGWMECFGEVEEGMLEELESMRLEMLANAETMCGEKYKQCPPNFAYGMMEYMMFNIKKNGKLPKKWKNKIDVSNTMPLERLEDHENLRRRLHHTCSDPVLGNVRAGSYPNANDPNCPMYTSVSEGGNGATCMCPYSGGPSVTSYYDDRYGTKFAWIRQFGADSVHCAGRCGASCNSLDQEAFLDCFDHDSCVDHLGGNILVGNADCDDELENAADDYIVSYGYCCCTCNWWIGCYC